MAYPVSIHVEPQLQQKNRLTSAFRPFLAIPHAILVGPVVRLSATGNSPGLLAAAAYFLAVVSWFTILFFVDNYPPFGDEPYPASIEVVEPAAERDGISVALRVILALPHFIVLFFLLLAWLVLTIVAWLVVLFTGSYPASIYPFSSGVMRWALRVEAYMLLLVDEYPPFSLE